MKTLRIYQVVYKPRHVGRSTTINVAAVDFEDVLKMVRSESDFHYFISIVQTDTFVRVETPIHNITNEAH